MKKDEPTQSQKKLIQYLEDLKRNKFFTDKLNELRKEFKVRYKNIDDYIEDLEGIEDSIVMHYEELKQTREKYEDLLSSRAKELFKEISEEYSLSPNLINLLIKDDSADMAVLALNNSEDFCLIKDDYQKIIDIQDGSAYSIEFDNDYINDVYVYPVSINIHRFSSKRDLLKFVEKRWTDIETLLKHYRGPKKIRFRERKYTNEFLDFIWENKDINAVELASLANLKFKNITIGYNDIYMIISQENKKRTQKLT